MHTIACATVKNTKSLRGYFWCVCLLFLCLCWSPLYLCTLYLDVAEEGRRFALVVGAQRRGPPAPLRRARGRGRERSPHRARLMSMWGGFLLWPQRRSPGRDVSLPGTAQAQRLKRAKVAERSSAGRSLRRHACRGRGVCGGTPADAGGPLRARRATWP